MRRRPSYRGPAPPSGHLAALGVSLTCLPRLLGMAHWPAGTPAVAATFRAATRRRPGPAAPGADDAAGDQLAVEAAAVDDGAQRPRLTRLLGARQRQFSADLKRPERRARRDPDHGAPRLRPAKASGNPRTRPNRRGEGDVSLILDLAVSSSQGSGASDSQGQPNPDQRWCWCRCLRRQRSRLSSDAGE